MTRSNTTTTDSNGVIVKDWTYGISASHHRGDRIENGKLLAHSEQYATAASARRSARAFGKRHGIPVVEGGR